MTTGQPCSSPNVADLVGTLGELGGTGHDRCAATLGGQARRHLVAHLVDRLGRRSDPRDTHLGDRPGEVGVLGEEAVAGMHTVGAALADRVEDRLGVEVALGGRLAARARTPRRRGGRGARSGRVRSTPRRSAMPSSRAARMTRTAISPRLAIRIFCSTGANVGRMQPSDHAQNTESAFVWRSGWYVGEVAETGSTNGDLLGAVSSCPTARCCGPIIRPRVAAGSTGDGRLRRAPICWSRCCFGSCRPIRVN